MSSIFDDDIENTQIKNDEYYENMIVKVKGRLSKVFFPRNPEPMADYGYAIVRIIVDDILEGELHPKSKDWRGTVSLKGEMQALDEFEDYEFTIKLDEVSEQYGASYEVQYTRPDYDLSDVNGMKIFLGNILTETQVENMFETFDNPLEVLENENIKELLKVKGVGEQTAKRIVTKYKENLDYAEAYIELAEYGLTPNTIVKLSDELGSPTILIETIKKNPYFLTNVKGIGFTRADKIALDSGFGRESIERICAFIEFTLNDLGERGLSWIVSSDLVFLIEDNLGEIPMDKIIASVNKLKEENILWNGEQGKVGLMKYYIIECKIRDEIMRLMSGVVEVPENWEDSVRQAEQLQGYKYTDEQWDAIRDVVNSLVASIIGKAGVGKTTSVLGAIKSLGEIIFAMCALSGKASSRLEEVTGMDASTIHRLLGFNPSKGDGSMFDYNKDNKLPVEAVILDESSMVGGIIFLRLLEAIPTGARLVMIGDIRQLSPIGAMNVFYDFVQSESIPLGELKQIHRQASKSAIITESHKVSEGIQLFERDFTGVVILGELQDLTLDIVEKSWSIPDKILEYFIQELDRFKDILEVQVLSPLNLRGDTSVYALNKLIQAYYNPPSEDKKQVTCKIDNNKFYDFRVDDKCMCVKNNYKLEDTEGRKVAVFNGYTGIIKDIIGNQLIIDFPLANTEHYVIVPASHWNGKKGISLAYCATTAKSQGSGFKSVIYALDNSHYMLLCKEQLYTAMTRAKENMILVGERKAVIKAIETNEASEKQTHLPVLLGGGYEK